MKKNISCFALMILLTAAAIHAQDNWNNQNPATRPAAQAGHAMDFIGDDKVLFFGGQVSETWVYDLSDNTWTNKNPANSPSGRWYSAMAYLGDDKVLLYGGSEDIFDPNAYQKNDTWIYDLGDNTWTLKNPATNPGLRALHTMAPIGGDKVFLHGDVGPSNDTWIYDLSDNQWTVMNPATLPTAQQGGSRAANIGGDKILLFGSNTFDPSPDSKETWVYDLSDNNWTLKNPANKPDPRQLHMLASLGGDKILLFGGYSNNTGGFLNDTWIYDLSDDAWTLKNPASRPSERQIHSMSDAGNSKVLLFGGICESCPDFVNDETWLYTSAEVNCTMSVSAGIDEHLLFGYQPSQCATKTAVVTDGNAPFTYSWTLNRALLPGETMTGANTASVTVCLMDTAELCVTVTDAANCSANDCATIFAEDVRCGNNQNQKVRICHNNTTICVDANAVAGHLGHGDYVGPCTTVTTPGDISTEENTKTGFSIFPNPGNGQFSITVNLQDKGEGQLKLLNMNGQIIRTINIKSSGKIDLSIDKPGIYIAQLINGTQIISKKIVVAR